LAVLAGGLAWAQTDPKHFQGTELLGRPTSVSVTVNVAPAVDMEVYFESGTATGAYDSTTAPQSAKAGVPAETKIEGLTPDTQYFYRIRYRLTGESEYRKGEERTFQTQRPRGSTFTFALQADPHMDENSDPEIYRQTLANELAAKPDFMIDLGDTFMSDKLGRQVTYNQVLDRHLLMRSYYDLSCHSMPLLLVLGNHEGEWGRDLDGTEDNLPVRATRIRKQYFPNPVPDDFYSGNEKEEPLVGLRQNYYSWEWGDALFVVLDPYWNLPRKPEQAGDWSLTLGREQYDWLKRVLEGSSATFKFVFCHNLVGGWNMGGQMRGGVEAARYLEWGGYNLDGTWGFEQARPGWEMPIHELLKRNKVTAFFHGHDHLFVKQELDGILYYELPQPSAKNYNLGNRPATYGYTEGDMVGGSGYLRVTVSPAEAKIDYIMTWIPSNITKGHENGEVAHSLTVRADGAAAVPASRYPVVDTGLRNCYDDTRQIPCPAAGEAFHGQDAHYPGPAAKYADNGDGTVSDLNTGLMWQKTPDLANKATCQEAVEGAKKLDLGGYSDWRLPTIKELYSLIDFRGSSFRKRPYIDTAYFDFRFGDESTGERLIDAQYWSATEYVGTTMRGDATVFGVNFADGRIKGYPRDTGPDGSPFKEFVRYVRGNPDYGVNRFVDNGDGTVTDQATGLMWQKADDGVKRNWKESLAYAEGLTLAGHGDWRLPSAKQLQSIVDYTRAPDAADAARRGPAIDPVFGVTEAESYFWTGTTHLDGQAADAAAYVAFGRAMGYMPGPAGAVALINVHGAGAQRSDPKSGDPAAFPQGRGPQGDDIRIYNYVRAVRVASNPESKPARLARIQPAPSGGDRDREARRGQRQGQRRREGMPPEGPRRQDLIDAAN
jgi:hypothetical protein